MQWISAVFPFLVPMVAIVATFAFVGLVVWSKHRRSERDAYYRHELVKQMVSEGRGDDQLLGFLREEARQRQDSRRRGLMVGGLVTLAVGLGYMFGFQWLEDDVWMIGAIPVLIGVALLAGSLLFRRSDADAQ